VHPSALAEDGGGAAASVVVSGGNRVRLTDGAALLKDVRITADAPGTFCLTIASASRRVRRCSGRLWCVGQFDTRDYVIETTDSARAHISTERPDCRQLSYPRAKQMPGEVLCS